MNRVHNSGGLKAPTRLSSALTKSNIRKRKKMIDYDSVIEVVGMEGRHLSRLSVAGNIMLISAWLKAEAASVAVREARTYTN